MKTVNKILIITFAFFLAILLAGMIILRLLLPGTSVQNIRNPGKQTSQKYDYQQFDSVSLSGSWTADIQYGTNYSVELDVPAGLTDLLDVKQTGKKLEIGFHDRGKMDGRNKWKAHIVMPGLARLEAAGGNKITISGFHSLRFETEVSGASELTGNNNDFQDIKLISSGVSHIDFSDTASVNADVELSGAGKVDLNMKGGILSGNISGVSGIRYKGTVSTKAIQVSGMSSIKQE